MANTRLSRQQVEIIGRLETQLRVGGQSILVIGDPVGGDLRVHGISLEYLTKIGSEAAQSDIGISDGVDLEHIHGLITPITLGQTLDSNQHMESPDEPLTLGQEVGLSMVLHIDVGSTLSFGQSTALIINEEPTSDVGIGQTVGLSGVYNKSLTSSLTLSDEAFPVSHPHSSSDIGIGQGVQVQKVVYKQVSDEVGVDDSFIRTGDTRLGVTSALNGWYWQWDAAFQQYQREWAVMSGTATAEHVIGERPIYLSVGNTLNLQQSFSSSNVFNRQPESTLNIGGTVGYVFIQDTTFCDYAPMVGRTTLTDLPTPPPSTPPSINPAAYDGIQLSYPVVAPTETVYLRGPEFGNKDSFSTQRINRESRGGSLTVMREPYWPKVKQMSLTFTGLTELEGQEILNLVETSVGKEVKLRDWEGREWLGVITSTTEPIVRDRDDCKLTTNLEFELTDGT